MKHPVVKARSSVTRRLLEIREQAGDSVEKHAHYHELINRYQRVLMKNYLVRYRNRLQAHLQLMRRISAQVQVQWRIVKKGYCLYRQLLHNRPLRIKRAGASRKTSPVKTEAPME